MMKSRKFTIQTVIAKRPVCAKLNAPTLVRVPHTDKVFFRSNRKVKILRLHGNNASTNNNNY